MASVAVMLNSYSLALSIPSKPAYFIGSGTRMLPDMQLHVDNVGATRLNESMNQVSITDPYPR
jgi:predicted secreted protein